MTLHSFQWAMMPASAGGSADLSWTAPETNANGDTFNNSTNDRTLAGYHVYGRRTIDAFPSLLATTASTSVTVTGLSSGEWIFFVAAYDGDGDESDPTYLGTKVIA